MTTPLDLNAIEQRHKRAMDSLEASSFSSPTVAAALPDIPQLCEAVRELREKVKGLEKYSPTGRHAHFCHCGTASKRGIHLIGHLGCVRFMTAAPEARPGDRWFVDGAEITDYTLRFQRGYHMHECGCWSRSPGSDNSIEA